MNSEATSCQQPSDHGLEQESQLPADGPSAPNSTRDGRAKPSGHIFVEDPDSPAWIATRQRFF